MFKNKFYFKIRCVGWTVKDFLVTLCYLNMANTLLMVNFCIEKLKIKSSFCNFSSYMFLYVLLDKKNLKYKVFELLIIFFKTIRKLNYLCYLYVHNIINISTKCNMWNLKLFDMLLIRSFLIKISKVQTSIQLTQMNLCLGAVFLNPCPHDKH